MRLLLHNDARVHEAYLVLKKDGCDEYFVKMEPGEWLESYRFYSCNIKLSEGLYWYYFTYSSDYGTFFVKKKEHSLGIIGEDGECFQQTVYDADYSTPDWLDGGIIYQIFPDRFAKSGKEKKNVPQDRYMCKDWKKQPEYKQSGDICHLGNDYYGGDFAGIEQKLDYLKELGVNCIYFNPIFEAHSNHRYDTANYLKIDPVLGTEEEFISLIKAAAKRDIYIILDGVFSHTGDDSIYFNKYCRYNSEGAYNSYNSKYRSWYKFGTSRDDYSAWWGILTLPETNENDPSFNDFINGENGVIRYWLKKGIRGWRLDVADELPDLFLDNLRNAVKAEGEDKYLLGEVWEDATNKISYGSRRRFLRGKQLDSVMNYPFANGIFRYLKGGNSRDLLDLVLEVLENYPPQAVKLLMNHIGTHDTARAITRLGCDEEFYGDREAQSQRTLTEDEYKKGKRLLKLAAVLQYTLPGVPSVYYGDEAGVYGFSDPFCRGTYPWGEEDKELIEFYKKLGQFRRKTKAFASGEFIPVYANYGSIVYIRKKGESEVLIAVNRWHEETCVEIPEKFAGLEAEFGNGAVGTSLKIEGESFCIIPFNKK
ncbi:MAG: glycoside hydrolase family 13 protein [Clostridia bacterium]|nr:glycoside hydrolase family 13 protein [Clostridia bacterium]